MAIIYVIYCLMLTGCIFTIWYITDSFNANLFYNKWSKIICLSLYLLPGIYMLFRSTSLYEGIELQIKGSELQVRVEWATKVDFPEFSVTDYIKGKREFTGDYKDTIKVSFCSLPDDGFYKEIERLCNKKYTSEEDDPSWRQIDSKHYKYSRIWGGPFPDPDGNYNHDNASLEVIIEKGSRDFIIIDGRW